MRIRRFADAGLGGMTESTDGYWVPWEDYARAFHDWEVAAKKAEHVLNQEIERLTAEIAYVIGCTERIVTEMERRTEWSNAKINELAAHLGQAEAQIVQLNGRTFTTVQGETFSHCTMPERAVLDAAYAIPDAVLHAPITHAEKLIPLCDAIQRWRRG